jgi:Zn-dependent peptidase ImmA (M78 family)
MDAVDRLGLDEELADVVKSGLAKMPVATAAALYEPVSSALSQLSDLLDGLTRPPVTPDRSNRFHWFGVEGKLEIGLRFSSPRNVDIAVSLGTKPIWGSVDNGGLPLDCIAFLRFFGENWRALWLESFPDNAQLSNATVAQWLEETERVEKLVGGLPDLLATRWHNFRSRHCLTEDVLLLSRDAADVSPIWLVPMQTGDLLVDAPDRGIRISAPIAALMHPIERACSMIACKQLSSSREGDDGVAAWRARAEARSDDELVKLWTAVEDPLLIAQMLRDIENPRDFTEISKNEIVGVARMRPGDLPNVDLQIVFEEIEKTQKLVTEVLDALAAEASNQFALLLTSAVPHFEQGCEIATWLRTRLNIDGRAHPAALLEGWGVRVKKMTLSTHNVDAIAFWGLKHGPAVLVNTRGKHSRSRAGARATLAHEICHLLVDRRRALPIGDVLGGHVPHAIEKRARAFAAEFLLPQQIAYEKFIKTDGNLHDTAYLLADLVDDFKVSRLIAAYQLRAGIRRFQYLGLKREVTEYLDSYVDLYMRP